MSVDAMMSRPSDEVTAARLVRTTVLGRYVVDAWVRDGGMASLYRGHHARTGARVAIKVQRRSEESRDVVSARFEREAEVMGRLAGHRSVAQIHDLAELPDGRRYLVMEWVTGMTLEDRLDQLRDAEQMMPLSHACCLLLDVARGLAAAHGRGVVHRDLNPTNVMLEDDGAGRESAKLIDFGISAELDGDPDALELTATGVGLGTSGYMAPEQTAGLSAAPGFDLYAFGVVSFEVLTGLKAPPSGRGPRRLPSIERYRSSVSADWSALIAECLEPDPKLRPVSADEVIERLEAVHRSLAGGRNPRGGPGLESARPGLDVHERSSSPAVDGPARVGWWAGLVGVVTVIVILLWRCDVLMPAVTEGALEGTGRSLHGAGTAADRVRSGSPGEEAPDGAESTSRSASTSGERTSSYAMPDRESTGGVTETIRSTTRSRKATVGSDADGSGKVEVTEDSGRLEPRDPVSPHRPRCDEVRDAAEHALRDRRWRSILEHTSDPTRCWSSRERRIYRTVLRVKALAELGRYRACVDEGAGSIEPSIARVTRLCRSQLERAEKG